MSFGWYVFEQSPAKYSDKVLVMDDEKLRERENIDAEFRAEGFEIVKYTDDLDFRIRHEEDVKAEGKKIAVFAETFQYVPYDILKRLTKYAVSLRGLFAGMDVSVIEAMDRTGLDLTARVYSKAFVKGFDRKKTEEFIKTKVLSKENISGYIAKLLADMKVQISHAQTVRDWFQIAECKARIDVLAVQNDIEVDTSMANEVFKDYCIEKFGTLSSKLDKESPVLVSRVMEYIHAESAKYVIIVMDGMSEFDWNILSESFGDIVYHKSSVMAMIPSTTSVSRQCLLSGKLPSQLENPWKQDKEKKEFSLCAKEMGFSDNQIGYERGYEAEFSASVRCGVVIIMDVDELVHAQKQGRTGMAQDIRLMSRQGRLAALTQKLLSENFDVYITADHGNTACTGMGYIKGAGVEVETKSRRFLVLKDFADKEVIEEKYGLLEYPKYYLPKEYDYLLCDTGKSFDLKGENVMSHGGITIDEVVVPFITIKAVENNG